MIFCFVLFFSMTQKSSVDGCFQDLRSPSLPPPGFPPPFSHRLSLNDDFDVFDEFVHSTKVKVKDVNIDVESERRLHRDNQDSNEPLDMRINKF